LSSSRSSRNPVANKLLAAIPRGEYSRLLPHLELVSLPLKQVLHEADEPIEYAYFPLTAVVSVLTLMSDGEAIEAATVGNEGMVGIPAVLGDNIASLTAMVQREDSGMRMKARKLKTEFQRGGVLQSLLLRYTQAQHAFVSQNVVCNRLHPVDERLARWLLLFCDRVGSNELLLTQESISKMLGVRRPGVTEAAYRLQQAGVIRYSRGKLTILNRQALEAASCSCYGIINGEYARLLA